MKLNGKRSISGLAGILLICGAQLAEAADQWCTGTIKSVLIDSAGQVLIKGSWRNDFTMVCSVVSTWGSVTADTCKTWYTLATSARVSQIAMEVYYYNTSYTCSTLPTWGSAPAPSYMRLVDP
jgi:hypothetical protein